LIDLFFTGSTTAVKQLTRGVFVGLVGLCGCAEDNETEAQKLAKGAGSPGAPAASPASTKAAMPTPTSSDGAFKQNSSQEGLPSSYPKMKR
jgi:hypothetical protein